MRRVLLGAVALSVAATACANPLGRGVPECDTSQLSSSMVIQVQSIPSATYVSCIYGLKTGWSYEDLEARTGRAVYWLDSDRMGPKFLTVESLPSCEPTGLPADLPDDKSPGVELLKDVETDATVDIVLVPEGPSDLTVRRAFDLAQEIDGTEIKDRTVVATLSDSGESTRTRIDRAAAGGAHVIAISIRNAEENTLTLRLAGTGEQAEFSVNGLGAALDEIEDVETQPSYRGTWYYVFDGGCVVYTFNAVGPGVTTLEEDIELVLGLFDAAALRRIARDEGFEI